MNDIHSIYFKSPSLTVESVTKMSDFDNSLKANSVKLIFFCKTSLRIRVVLSFGVGFILTTLFTVTDVTACPVVSNHFEVSGYECI